jgi:riboflavin kinase/FMN adenylyltransferase
LEQTSVPQLETHLFGQCPFDAGDFITVEWLRFLRPEKKFASLDELKAQIARDVEAAQGLGSGTAKAVGGL